MARQRTVKQRGAAIASFAAGLTGLLWLGITSPAAGELSAQAPIAPTAETSPRLAQVPLSLTVQGIAAVGLAVGAIALFRANAQDRQRQDLQRLQFIRQIMREFEQDPAIHNALQILDLEEYQDFWVDLPELSQPLLFKANDERLRAALMRHDQRARKQQAVDRHRDRLQADMTDERVRHHQIETVLRGWFDQLLRQLAQFEHMIVGGYVSPQDLEPWLMRWLRLIADHDLQRRGGSAFYDQLYSYIHYAGYKDVQSLFQRFGYRILPSPYQAEDFPQRSFAPKGINLPMALSLAKASHLIYNDLPFITRIIDLWGICLRHDFRFISSRDRNTQAFLFRTPYYMVLAFRGTQEIQDWQTNLNTRFKRINLNERRSTPIKGQVHSGFFLAWESVAGAVYDQIQRWYKDDRNGHRAPPLWITGHSLGGALATVSSVDLKVKGVPVAGVYTYGQPRVGDRTFARQVKTLLPDRYFRFVNFTDVVPRVPTPISLRNPFGGLYVHSGQLQYFGMQGQLDEATNALRRFIDYLRGSLGGFSGSGLGWISNHYMEHYLNHLQIAVEAYQANLDLQAELAALEHTVIES